MSINPSLTWGKQFDVMKEKLYRAMSKLKSTPLNIANACVCFNICVISKVHFGCGIIILNEKQEETLMKITESMLLMKLCLSEKFPKTISHAKKVTTWSRNNETVHNYNNVSFKIVLRT